MTDCPLAVSEVEVARYRLKAATALVHEAAQLREAGIVKGAVVADIGCGPAAMSALAAEVRSNGRVIGIERDEQALATDTRCSRKGASHARWASSAANMRC